MSQAIQICADAYRQANLDQDLTSFSTGQEYPYNIALSLMNTVLQEMNRLGNYWFCETSTPLSYSSGVSQWNLATLLSNAVDPRRVTRIRSEAANDWNELIEVNYRTFQKKYRTSAMATGQPNFWSKYQTVVYTDTIPDQDYTLKLYYFQDMPPVQSEADTLLVPIKDEDVVREGVYAYLCERIGRPDFQSAYQLYLAKASALLADTKKDAGLPTQMPAAF